jgi:hypothetical protein
MLSGGTKGEYSESKPTAGLRNSKTQCDTGYLEVPLNAAMAALRHRGPIPHSTTMDDLLLYLIWLKSGMDYATIAKIFKMSESRLEDDLNRVRGPLLQSLESK